MSQENLAQQQQQQQHIHQPNPILMNVSTAQPIHYTMPDQISNTTIPNAIMNAAQTNLNFGNSSLPVQYASMNNQPLIPQNESTIAAKNETTINNNSSNTPPQTSRTITTTITTNANNIKILSSPPNTTIINPINSLAQHVNSKLNVTAASSNNQKPTRDNSSHTTSDDTTDSEDEEENEVVEESSDGRWSKRNESVSQRDVPGIDYAYLAMDTEYGFEVVWNEIKLSGGKKFKKENLHDYEMEIDRVFKNLINLNHPNIVKFHDYWIDKRQNDPRIIFITEYLSSGSLKQFLRKAKKTNQSIKKSTWKRWCIQLLTALHYLHNCDPPIVHGDLSCDTIFIQHNGLIKIGSIAPDIVNTHVKTCIDFSKWSRHMHFIAPEIKEPFGVELSTSENSITLNNNNMNNSKLTTTVDMYAFGMVALEMFNLEFGGNGDTHPITHELIKQSIEALDPNQQDFINKCLQVDPLKRPSAKELLFHPLLFEVPSLKLLAAHQLVKHHNDSKESNNERIFNDSAFVRPSDFVIASLGRKIGDNFEFKYNQLTAFDANKYLEDVKNGIYPLTAYGLDYQLKKHDEQKPEASSNQISNNSNNNTNSLIMHLDLSNMLLSGNSSLAKTVSSKSSSSSSVSPLQSLSQIALQNQHESEQENNLNSEIISSLPKLTSQPNTEANSINNTNENSSKSSTPVPIQAQVVCNTASLPISSSPQNINSYNIQQFSRTQSPILNPNNSNNTNNNNNNGTTSASLSGELLNGNLNMDANLNQDPFAYNPKLETRHAQKIDTNVILDESLRIYKLSLTITFEDRTARFIQSPLSKHDTFLNLADELINNGLVNESDRENLCLRLKHALTKIEHANQTSNNSEYIYHPSQNNLL